MRILYSPVWEGLQRSLVDIFIAGFPADKVIQRQLKLNKKWGSHDRRLFAESLYDMVRWWRKLLYICDVQWPSEDRWSNPDPKVFAAVTAAWCYLNQVELGKNISHSNFDIKTAAEKWSDTSLPRAVRESIPNWLDEWIYSQLGEKWNDLVTILNTVAPVYLRTNRLKISPEQLIAKLSAEKISAEIVEGDVIRLKARTNVFLSKSFHAGYFEVQDQSSQMVAPVLGVQPGERVIDACAGAGGKTLHLAALMGNKGRVLAMDVEDKKLESLRERAKRAGATSIETRLISSTKVIKRLHESADRILLDAPCSGLGVWRRNPDGRWKFTREDAERLKSTQRDILQNYSRMVKPGGTMVYATCSILPEENERQIESFLSQSSSVFKLEMQETLWPKLNGPDGFFLARLTRVSN